MKGKDNGASSGRLGEWLQPYRRSMRTVLVALVGSVSLVSLVSAEVFQPSAAAIAASQALKARNAFCYDNRVGNLDLVP